MSFHFISDLHLHPERPGLSEIFLRYLAGPARDAQRLYILGDLFEVWAGDEVSLPDYATEIAALNAVRQSGTAIYFIAGNRDFLCGQRFAQASGCEILREPQSIELPDGRTALLLHGDRLCTDDHAYQRFRRWVRNPLVQRAYFALPSAVRRRLVTAIRGKASRTVSTKPLEIMDVNETSVAQLFAQTGVALMIHGHTHRPQDHNYKTGQQRMVLADWSQETGEVLIVDSGKTRRQTLS